MAVATRTITITGERLAAMYDNDMGVYGTPSTWEPYWASRPNFMYDKQLATVDELLEQGGWESIDELRTDEESYEFTINIPEDEE